MAAEALGRLGPDAQAALPVLIGLANKGSVGYDVTEALVRIDPEGKVCLSALIRVSVGAEQEMSVAAAAKAVGLLGPRAKWGRFRACGNDSEPQVRVAIQR